MRTSHNPGIDGDLAELLSSLIDESISDEQFARLDQRLQQDPETRRLYLDYLQIHDDLHTLAVRMVVDDGWAQLSTAAPRDSGGSGDVATPRVAANQTSRSDDPSGAKVVAGRKLRPTMFVGLAVLVLVALSAFLWTGLLRQPAAPPATLPESFATLTRATDCVWEGPTQPQLGDTLPVGAVTLLQGMAEIRLANGVDILIEAPASMQLVDAGSSVLNAGRVVARVPPTAVGYVIDTPKARVVDLGTEFGVCVEPDHETIVQVFAGTVVAELKTSAPADKRSHRLVAGETVRIDASGAVELQSVAFSHERFLQTFSTPSVHEGEELIPFKPSEVSSLEVVAAPEGVTIDGDLSDWGLSGGFQARCPDRFAESYYVHGNMRYDQQYLYIAAQVGDPMPMRNAVDPNTDPWSAWLGGSLQFRLATDRTFGWPLKASRYRSSPNKQIPQDTSDRIVHLTLWYFQPREQPCLEIRYGMNLARGLVNPPGWQGAFRKAPDGKSYTVECAIPWVLLGAGNDPPQAGDELGLCWTVNWSDASGKRWKGQLIEIKNPAYAARGKQSQTFIFGETWGKAVYR